MHPERSRSHGPGGLKRCSACGEEKRAAAFPPELAWSAPLLVDSFTTAALDSAGGNGHRTPAALAIAQDHTPGADQEAATAPDARQRVRALIAREHAGGPKSPRPKSSRSLAAAAAAPTSCSATPAPSTSPGKRPWTCVSSTATARPADVASASLTTRAASAASAPTPASRPPTLPASAPGSRPASEPRTTHAANSAKSRPAANATALAAPRRARRDQPPRPLLRDLRRPPQSPHHSPRPGRPRPRPAPLQRPTRQGRLDRVPRGSRRLPGQAEQLRAKYGL